MTNSNDRRLIEAAFPLKQTSLDSVHEKNVRHGHISTLHIWPARRPLAAARAALIATLLPDPGTEEERRKLVKKIGGTVETDANGKEKTRGGVLHWKREDNPEMDEFREMIREHYGRAPKVLDPFAGGGAIPLEAMRLGCDVTAIDLNPVAWFILKCTLEYPQKLAGKTHPLPDFALENPAFMDTYFHKAAGLSYAQRKKQVAAVEDGSFDLKQTSLFDSEPKEADLSWHVRAWGHWVLDEARKELAEFYPTYAHFETAQKPAEPRSNELKRVPTQEDGTLDMDALNGEYSDAYLEDDTNPRWVAKPTVAYLWARTVPCKNCRATLPLLKTQWLCRKSKKRIRLSMEPKADGSGVSFGVEKDVPKGVDKSLTGGTMSRSGATCPCCGATMTKSDIRQEGKAGRLGQVMTAVVIDGPNGKEYRLPTDDERTATQRAEVEVADLYEEIPFGLPTEPTPKSGKGASRAFSVDGYGFDQWHKLFTPRQLLALGTFVKHTRRVLDEMKALGYEGTWPEAVRGQLALVASKVADYSSSVCTWHVSGEKMRNTFSRFAIPITWDFTEVRTTSQRSGGYAAQLEWIGRVNNHLLGAAHGKSNVIQQSATQELPSDLDTIVTDPPYYDAIPYSDAMDFFYVWLRRSLHGLSDEIDQVFSEPLAPKWNHDAGDGELIDDASRFDGDRERSKQAYEDGMAEAFKRCYEALNDDGRLCIVFANKSPDAWETLASAVIRAGFVVDASWPIETEMATRTRAHTSAALSSSIWIVCRKRPKTARSGWDRKVLEEMRENIITRLRQFWDAGIRGPDFVWAATGPAMEAYSKHPVVKKADEPGKRMDVAEFLTHVRREVVDFAVGRVLSQNGHSDDAEGLDDVTAYYLLHRNDYGFEKAPVGACILYAMSCGLNDSDLWGRYDLVDSSGSKAQLKSWKDRANLKDTKATDEPPLIDQVHRLMHLWKSGDQEAVDRFIESQGLGRHGLFQKVLQALIELASNGERSILESISNHLRGHRGAGAQAQVAEQSGLFE